MGTGWQSWDPGLRRVLSGKHRMSLPMLLPAPQWLPSAFEMTGWAAPGPRCLSAAGQVVLHDQPHHLQGVQGTACLPPRVPTRPHHLTCPPTFQSSSWAPPRWERRPSSTLPQRPGPSHAGAEQVQGSVWDGDDGPCFCRLHLLLQGPGLLEI